MIVASLSSDYTNHTFQDFILMNTHSPHCYLMVWSIALMCAACFHVYGDEAKDNLPLIEQKCVPSFDKGYITLSITNKTDHPVAIDPLIRAEFVFHNGLIMPPPAKKQANGISSYLRWFLSPPPAIMGFRVMVVQVAYLS